MVMVILVIPICLVVVLILLLAVPLRFEFMLQRTDHVTSQFKIGWLMGLVTFPIKSEKYTDSEVPVRQTRKKDKKPKTNKSKRITRNIYTMKRLISNAKFRRRLFRLIIDVFNSIQIRNLIAHVQLGLDDPADTGRLWGMIGPVSVFLSSIPNIDFKCEPNFEHLGFFIESRGEVRIIPLGMLLVVFRFVLSPTTIGALISSFRPIRYD